MKRYRQHPQIRITELEDEGVVLHLGARRYFSVSSSGLVMLEALASPQSADDLVALLLDRYEVEREEAESSVREFLAHCEQSKLLVVDGDEA